MSASTSNDAEGLLNRDAESMVWVLRERAKIAGYGDGKSHYDREKHAVSLLSISEYRKLLENLKLLSDDDSLKGWWVDKCR